VHNTNNDNIALLIHKSKPKLIIYNNYKDKRLDSHRYYIFQAVKSSRSVSDAAGLPIKNNSIFARIVQGKFFNFIFYY